MLEEHQTIIDSIESRDKGRATQITGQHIKNQAEAVVDTIREKRRKHIKMNRVQLSGNTPYISRSDDRKKMRKIRKNLTGQWIYGGITYERGR